MILFTQKIVTKLSKICVWDPGSGKNLFTVGLELMIKIFSIASGGSKNPSLWQVKKKLFK
jgi:hypothetical protein